MKGWRRSYTLQIMTPDLYVHRKKWKEKILFIGIPSLPHAIAWIGFVSLVWHLNCTSLRYTCRCLICSYLPNTIICTICNQYSFFFLKKRSTLSTWGDHSSYYIVNYFSSQLAFIQPTSFLVFMPCYSSDPLIIPSLLAEVNFYFPHPYKSPSVREKSPLPGVLTMKIWKCCWKKYFSDF